MTDTISNEPMTGATLRCTRERMGLTTRWLSIHLKVAERTVHRWEADVQTVPDGIRTQVLDLVEKHAALIAELRGSLAALRAENDPVMAPLLITYRTDNDVDAVGAPDAAGYPASWHRAAVGAVLADAPHTPVVYRVP